MRTERVTLDDFSPLSSRATLTPADIESELRAQADLVWLERADTLLGEPDPGPTPFLVEELIVEQAIATIVGLWKVAKSYSLLELAIAISTGRKAFGVYEVARPGPVVLVMEESGRAAFQRRLDRLSRGYALAPEALGNLHFAANVGVRLNDEDWQEKLLLAGERLRPRAFFFDPLVRMKGATVDESSQREIGPVLDFMHRLREESGAAVVYAHHLGHQGSHQRGSSDLEGFWESRLGVKKDTAGVRTITADHREAESGHSFRFLLDFDEETHSLRMRALADTRVRQIEEYLRERPDASDNEIVKQIGGRRTDVLQEVGEIRERLSQSGSQSGNHSGTTPSDLPRGRGSPEPAYGGSGTTPIGDLIEVVPDDGNHLPSERPRIGDESYLPWLFSRLEAGLIVESEWHRADRAHRFVTAAGDKDRKVWSRVT